MRPIPSHPCWNVSVCLDHSSLLCSIFCFIQVKQRAATQVPFPAALLVLSCAVSTMFFSLSLSRISFSPVGLPSAMPTYLVHTSTHRQLPVPCAHAYLVPMPRWCACLAGAWWLFSLYPLMLFCLILHIEARALFPKYKVFHIHHLLKATWLICSVLAVCGKLC